MDTPRIDTQSDSVERACIACDAVWKGDLDCPDCGEPGEPLECGECSECGEDALRFDPDSGVVTCVGCGVNNPIQLSNHGQPNE